MAAARHGACASHRLAWHLRLLRHGAAALLALGLALPVFAQSGLRDPRDPWERYNRDIFTLNEALDRIAIRPAAEFYRATLPHWLRVGVDNMYHNLGDVWSGVNLLLQAKPRQALETTIRVGTNSLFGVFGFFDVAEELGLDRGAQEDFGQTLGVWGMPVGPYLVLPLFGPSSVRDGLGMVADLQGSGPGLVLTQPRERNLAAGLQVLNKRVALLTASQVLDSIALDKYVLLRDAYLARRRSLVYDGNPPEDAEPEGK